MAKVKTKIGVAMGGVILAAIVAFVLIGCSIGNGIVVSDARPAAPFRSVHTVGMVWHVIGDCSLIQIEVRNGPEAKLVVSGESNIVPHVNTTIDEAELSISLSRFVYPKSPIRIVATSTGRNWSKDIGPRYLERMACQSDMKMQFPQ